MYQLRLPGLPPTQNERMKPGNAGSLRTTPEVKAYQETAGLVAKAALAGVAGFAGPLQGPLCALYVFRVPNGRRDWEASIKDPQDALNGIAWEDDRQILMGTGIVDRKAAVAEVVVYFGPLSELLTLTALAETLGGAILSAEGGTLKPRRAACSTSTPAT